MTQTSDAPMTSIDRAAAIVAAYVSNNSVPTGDLPSLLASVHGALQNLGHGPAMPAEASAEKATPAQIRKSVTHDALISFEDGKGYKTLKRHLSGRGLTPETYRAKYGLPMDYPMVAPSYSEQRSSLAKSLGLGRPGSTASRARTAQAKANQSETAGAPKKGRGGRRKAEPAQAAA